MKPNLIDYKLLENDLSILEFNKNSNNLNIILIATIIFVLFLIFFIFRAKNTKKERINHTLNKLLYIYNKSTDEIEKKQNIYNNLIENSQKIIGEQSINEDLSEYGVQDYHIQSLGNSRRDNSYNQNNINLDNFYY